MVNGVEAGYLNQGRFAPLRNVFICRRKTGCGTGAAERQAQRFAPGSPLDERTLMGPLANRQQYDKVLRLIQTARDEAIPSSAAAKRCRGGLFPAADRG